MDLSDHLALADEVISAHAARQRSSTVMAMVAAMAAGAALFAAGMAFALLMP